MLGRERFIEDLRRALGHLYDPYSLRQSPLGSLLGVESRFDSSVALRKLLVEAIDSFEPLDDEPLDSPNWLVYGPLHYRYVQQLDREQAAHQLGISVRHLSRRTRDALEQLADSLWSQSGLSSGEGERDQVARSARDEAPVARELSWLEDEPPTAVVDLCAMLVDLEKHGQALALQHNTHLELQASHELPELTSRPLALKQALLSLLGAAIRRACGGEVIISATHLPEKVEIEFRTVPGRRATDAQLCDDQARLQMAEYLAELCGGDLVISTSTCAAFARLALPALDQVRVLVIDDNTDTLQLLQRYAQNTRYSVAGTADPNQALSLARRVSPQIIVLDVMMPNIDGWELLATLKQSPLTSAIPIVICTILTDEDLAYSLGASGFVTKPVTRDAFLGALDQQVLPGA
jgi:CheY-like chemotaxis protein